MSTYMNDPGSDNMFQMGPEWSPEFGGFLIVMGSAIIAAATSGYLVMAIAFVREHRRKAAQDWARARREWDRVTKERADYMALTFAREHEALENQRDMAIMCTDSDCPGMSFPHAVHQTRAWADKVRLIHDINAGFVSEDELFTAAKSDLADFGEAYAAKVLGTRDLTPEDQQRVAKIVPLPGYTMCIDPDCEWSQLPHTIKMHDELTPRVNPCVDPSCPSADTTHSHPLRPKEGQ